MADYPPPEYISKLLSMLRSNGMQPQAMDLYPDGSIKVTTGQAATTGAVDNFEEWERRL